MIENEKDILSKFDYMEQYAEICCRYGRKYRTIEIYQSMIDAYTMIPEKRMTIKYKLK